MNEPGPHSGTFRIPMADRDAAQRLRTVLEVEAQAVPEGTRVSVEVEDEVLVVGITAPGARSLRAAVNSFLRLAAIAVDVEADGSA